MARVSVTVSQKPKPVNTFKYLRRDEGRLSYTYNPSETTTTSRHDSSSTEQQHGARQSLRSAIARDMKSRKAADPFDDVVVAVPRKAPPPHGSTESTGEAVEEPSRPFTNAHPKSREQEEPSIVLTERKPPPLSSTLSRRKEEWVDINASPAEQWNSHGTGPTGTSPTARRAGTEEMKKGAGPNLLASGGEGPMVPRGGATALREQPVAQNGYERWGASEAPLQSSFGMGGGSSPLRGGGTAALGLSYHSPATEEPSGYGMHSDPGFQWRVEGSSSASRRLEEDYGYGNYFHRPARPHSVGAGSRSFQTAGRGAIEEQLMLQLQQELEAARFERQHFLEAKRQLQEERQRFESFRASAQAELDASQAQLAIEKSEIKRESQKELRTLEERHRTTTTLLEHERENNRRLAQENDLLNAQLNDLTTTMRESQRAQKAEVARLRRDVESLSHRNSELLAMARQQQIETLEASSQSLRYSSSSTVRNSAEKVVSPLKHQSTSSSNGTSSTLKQGHNRVDNPKVNEQSYQSYSSISGSSKTGLQCHGEAPLHPQIEELREAVEVGVEEENSVEVSSGDSRSRNFLSNPHANGRLSSPLASVAENAGRVNPLQNSHMEISNGAGTSRKNTNNSNGKVAQQIPTKEELLGPEEQIPSIDIPNDVIVSKTVLGKNSNKHKISYQSGKEEVKYSNGTTKIILPSGHTILQFVNGDIMRTFPSGRRTYWYEQAQTLHTQLPDKVELFEFLSTGQIERHLPNGEKNVLHADGTYDILRPDGTDETITPSGNRTVSYN